MLRCPACRSRLLRETVPGGLLHACPAGHGHACGLPPLRTVVGAAPTGRMWRAARRADRHGPPCPSCRSPTAAVPVDVGDGAVPVDVCTACHLVWLDQGERAALGAAGAPPPPAGAAAGVPVREEDLPPPAREALALARLEALRNRSGRRADEPPSLGHLAMALVGLPVEDNPDVRAGVPLATWTVAAVLAGVALLAAADLAGAVRTWGLVPARATASGGLHLLTYFFLHGGLLHLAGNLVFLVVFGDDVERYLGTARFLLILGAGTVLGGLAHVLVDPTSSIPLVGASAGISALLVLYVLRFPAARIGVLFMFHWVWVPMRVYAALWLVQQFVVLHQQARGLTAVSAAAHLGGALAGVAGWVLWRER